MTDCSQCEWGIWPVTMDYPCPVRCRKENPMEIDRGISFPVESPCPDFMRPQGSYSGSCAGAFITLDLMGIAALDKIMRIKDLVVDKPIPHGRIIVEFSTTLAVIEERRDMQNYFIFKGMRLLGNQSWEVYMTNECLRRRGVEPAHLATIHEPLTDNPGWQFHLTFGQSGIVEALDAFARVKQIFEDLANGYGSVSG